MTRTCLFTVASFYRGVAKKFGVIRWRYDMQIIVASFNCEAFAEDSVIFRYHVINTEDELLLLNVSKANNP